MWESEGGEEGAVGFSPPVAVEDLQDDSDEETQRKLRVATTRARRGPVPARGQMMRAVRGGYSRDLAHPSAGRFLKVQGNVNIDTNERDIHMAKSMTVDNRQTVNNPTYNHHLHVRSAKIVHHTTTEGGSAAVEELRMTKSLALVMALVAVVVVAQDYYYDTELCQNVQPGLWRRDPQDCMVAHQCGFDGEITQSVRCNASQVWSKLASSCVWEWDPDRDDCNGSPQVPMPNDPRCVKKTGNNPDPDDCSRFVSCANGTLIAIQRCGDGTLYWPRNNTCEFAQAVVQDCGNRRIPETIVIREDDPLCRENGQAPDPTSCRHFIQCQHGRRTQRIQCPHGTAFSETSRKCEWHSEVRCANRGE